MPQPEKIEKRHLSDRVIRFFDWLAIKFVSKRTIDGLPVFCNNDHAGKDADRVVAALGLIKQFDPVRYRRIIRDLNRIWITTIPGALGRFIKSTATCEIDRRFVLDEQTVTEQIASTIVHEATHARLFRRGIGYEEQLRARVEGICMGREQAFAAKLPDGASIRNWVEASRVELESLEFSNVAMHARRIDDSRNALLDLNAPAWLADVIVFFARRRHQRRIRRAERHSSN
ncbi:hypothetical protein [Mesorhizobium sp. M0088]|uniref:hypothetical protein n=1 Tax=Mesorhizobium sp. M0088 TaxID=2956873 RepID=UPI003335EAEC